MAENAAADGNFMAVLTDYNNLLKSDNARLKQENEKLSQEKQCLQEENDRLKQEKSSLQQTRSNLQKENNKLKHDINSLQQKYDFQAEVEITGRRMAQIVETENKKLTQDKNILQQENDALKQECNELKQKSDHLQNDNQRIMEENLRWITQGNLTKQQTYAGRMASSNWPSQSSQRELDWTGETDDRKPSTSGYQTRSTSQKVDKRSVCNTRQTYSPRTKELIEAELANPRDKTTEVIHELAVKAGKTEKQMRAALYYRKKRRPTEHSLDGNDSSDEVEVMN